MCNGLFPESVLARVFGVLQLTWMTTVGVGAIIAPALIHAFRIKATLIVTGLSVPRSRRRVRP